MSFSRNLIFSIIFTTSAAFCFGKDDDNFSWDDFTYNSPEEKAFWDKVPDWGADFVDSFDDDIQDPFWVFDSDGSIADENSTDLYTGYAKSMQRRSFYCEDRYGSSIYNQHERIIGYFKDGILSKISYFNESGKRLSQYILLGDGLMEEKEWYYNGQIAYKSTTKRSDWSYINAKSWLPNGDKCRETNLRNGTGKFFSYYENGQKMFEKNYKNGKRDGLSTEWYENGQKKKKVSYKNQKRDGPWTGWHENGQKFLEANYKDGKRLKGHKVWDEYGRPSRVIRSLLRNPPNPNQATPNRLRIPPLQPNNPFLRP